MLSLCSIEDSIASDECYDNVYIWRPRHIKRKYTVTVEGNIGSGKSTVLHYFKQFNKVDVLQEPVDKWQNVGGVNTLDLLYKDALRWSLTFQSYVQLTMLQNHTQKHTNPVKIMERSIYSVQYCFIENLYKSGLLADVNYTILSEWFNWIMKNSIIDVDLIVYLRADPQSCMERIKKRNRGEESSVPMEYVESLHELHEEWLVHQTKFTAPAEIIVLDANKNISDVLADIDKQRELILCGQT